MINSEFLPILSGVPLGSLQGYLRPSLRLRLGGASAISLGAVATIGSVEIFASGWYWYLLIDISLVAGCAAGSLNIAHRRRWVRR
jgi:hypothetical protein